ncbi:hypothetical protein H000_04287 [Escherichia coli UMEA 3899-1]|nr:hypothetical protein H000_04287 [Escherichia coli UMEA 3899-1]
MLPQHSDIEIAWYASIQQEPNGWKTVTTQFHIQEFSEYIAPLQDAGKSQRRKKDRCWRHGINIGYC